ncbi:hypothetical protein EXN61_22015 [Agrobacterium tumefaciens]|uniref:Uncharacterized protein n=1 Tax=Agrobacterium tumefaciens TaxID=358 RepID=A0A546XS12_AGRTU|nr:hypothetical protein [Agrobacterium tumefaciens]TRB03535.1 hypothetical protein EXN61_22015 [Agrobacterium tumefaciens]
MADNETRQPQRTNLDARAARLGMTITKTTTKAEAALLGGHRYRLHVKGQPATGVPINLLCLADRIKALEVKASEGKPVRRTARTMGLTGR